MSKFNKGDKILGQNYEMLGMYEGDVYTVKTCTEGEMTLEECFCKETGRNYTFTPSMYELIEKRNYREMTPNDLITISIEGIESEVPLDYFFQLYHDKQQQEKDELKTLIASKMEEVDALVKQLNQLNQM